MKQLLLLTFLFIAFGPCPAQFDTDLDTIIAHNWLGQTKALILKDNKECYIIANTADSLGLNCDELYMAFYFDAKTSLCIQYTVSIDPCKLFWVYWAAEYIGYHSTGFWTFEKGDLGLNIIGAENGRVWSVHYYLSDQIKNPE